MALPITQQLVARVGQSLGEGGWRFTVRQLWYACCAEAEVPPSNAYANGEIGVGVLLLLVALIALPLRLLFATLFAAGLALLALGLLRRLTPRHVQGRLLAMSFDDFRTRYGELPLHGLLHDGDDPHPAAALVAGAIIVCDTRDTALAIRANAGVAGLGAVHVVHDLSLLRAAAPQRVLTVHDASPLGCALPLVLRDDGIDVVDCGLRPASVNGAQVLEGAPARLPRDLSGVLQPDEIDWLLSGRRVEAATLTPQQLLTLVKDSLAATPGVGSTPARR